MKISSASKKVLASALSAAMVVAFAPTVAFGETTQMSDEAAIAAGYTVKVVSLTEGASTDVTTKYFTTLQQALAFDTVPSSAGTIEGLSGTVTLLKDQELAAGAQITAAASYASGGTFTIDLAGHTISGDVNNAVLAPSAGTITIKDSVGDGAITNENTGSSAASVANVVGIEGGTYNKAVSGAIAEIKGGTFEKAVETSVDIAVKGGTFKAGLVADDGSAGGAAADVTISAGSFSIEGVKATDTTTVETAVAAIDAEGDVTVSGTATVEAVAHRAGSSAYGIKAGGGVTVSANATKKTAGSLTVAATAEGNGKTTAAEAKAIDATGNVLVQKAVDTTTKEVYKAVLSAKAVAKGMSEDSNSAVSTGATAIEAADVTVESSATAEATVADDTATAYAVNATGDVDIAGGTFATSAAENKGYAVNTAAAKKIDIADGTFEGKLAGSTSVSSSVYKGIIGGSFSVNPKAYVPAGYAVVDNNAAYDVILAKAEVTGSLAAATSSNGYITVADENDCAVAAANGVIADIIAGTTPAGFVFADKQDASKLTAAIKASTTLGVQYNAVKINKRTATDAQKAAVASIDEFATKNLSVASDYYTVEVQLTYTAGGQTIVLGTITDLGETRGKANTLTMRVQTTATPAAAYATQGTEVIASYDGAATTQLSYTEKKGTYVTFDGSTAAIAVLEASDELLKDAVLNPEQPAPAPEKATQGIDVSQKSRTVKLAKGKTKTQKALYFKMGASAETALTTAKKSGSSRITVSGDKVTLKKGTKKGTYTAKVSLKAASSAEYLAAAKTITVKFVVKK